MLLVIFYIFLVYHTIYYTNSYAGFWVFPHPMDVADFPTWPLPGATKASTPADQQSQRGRRGRCACGLAWWALKGWTNKKNVKNL
jgi:hypothetical protein